MLDSNLKNALRKQRIALLVLSSSLICFLLIAFLRGSFSAVDASVNSWAASIQSTSFTHIAKLIHYGFGTTALSIITLLIAVYLFYKHYRNYALLLVGAMLGEFLIVAILKRLIDATRPLNGITPRNGIFFSQRSRYGRCSFLGLAHLFYMAAFQISKCKNVIRHLFCFNITRCRIQ